MTSNAAHMLHNLVGKWGMWQCRSELACKRRACARAARAGLAMPARAWPPDRPAFELNAVPFMACHAHAWLPGAHCPPPRLLLRPRRPTSSSMP